MRLLVFIILFFTSTLLANHKLEKVSLQLQWLGQFQFAGYYMAKQKGFYKDVGLDVDIKKFTSGLDVTKSVLEHNANYGTGRTSLIIEKSMGKKIYLMSTLLQSSPLVLISLKSSGIDKIEKFKNTKVMLSGNESSASIFAMMSSHGITQKDLEILKSVDKFRDLIDGKVDVISAYTTNEVYRLKQLGIEINVFKPKDYGFNFYSDILFTNENEYLKHPQRVYNFNSASLKGWEYAFNHIDETVELILKKYNPQNKTKEALIYEANELKKLAYYETDKLGKITKEKTKNIYDIYRIMQFIKNPIDFDKFIIHEKEYRFTLTKEEKEYLSKQNNLRVCVKTDLFPLGGFINNKHIGIMGDVFGIISKKLDLSFDYSVAQTIKEMVQKVQNNECDIVSILPQSNPHLKNFSVTNTVIEDYFTILTGLDNSFIRDNHSLEGKKLLTRYKSYKKYVLLFYPNLDIEVIDDLNKMFNFIKTKKAYGIIELNKSSDFIIQQYGYENIKVNGFIGKGHPVNGGIGIINTKPKLLNLFNKTIRSIKPSTYKSIEHSWQTPKYITTVDYTNTWRALAVTLITLVILLLFIYKNRQISKYNTELNRQKELYNTVVDNTLDGVSILDADTGKLIDCNEQAVKIFGYESKEKMLTLLPSDASPQFQPDGKRSDEKMEEILKILRANGTHSFEWLHVKTSGEEFLTEVTLTSLNIDNKNIIYSLWRDITQRKKAENELANQKDILHYQANHDALTNLPNRTLFNDRLEQSIQKAKRNKTEFALFFIDLDKFKQINDLLGHDIGDKVLIKISELLHHILRKNDTLARLGGDEFTIITEGLTKIQDSNTLAKKIIDTLVEPIKIDDRNLFVTCSIGISLYPKDSQNAHNLLKYADTAMYKAKDEGRNNYQFYSKEMTQIIFEQMSMENNLRNAIKNEEFIVYYQPQIDVRTNNIIGMEALVRWKHSSMGLISPNKFIPLAEDTGMIIEIDQLVMKAALQQVALWKKENLNTGTLSLNLSMKQLKEKDFINMIKDNLSQYSFNPEWLGLEITEGYVMQDPENTIVKLQELSNLGIKISIDDFGTGYSSLSYLKRLPIETLKIDQSFIRDIPEDEEDSSIVKAIIGLSESLHMEVIAEGVENEKQLSFLVENRCHNIQGYYYAKPMPASDMEAYIKEKRN